MRIVAASFGDDVAAHEARARLVADHRLASHQIGVEWLAASGDAVEPRAVLAGRFPDDLVPVVRRVVERLGGTVLLDIDAGESNA